MLNIYQTLCRLEQQHGYFQNEQTPSVTFAPTPATARNLQRAGLWVKGTATGLVLLRSTGEATGTRPLPAFLFPLRFRVQPLSPYFANFTELPDSAAEPGSPRAIFYFGAGPGKADTTAGRLAALNGQKTPQLPLTPLTLTFATSQPPAAKAVVRLMDAAGKRTLRELPVDEAGRVAVDVRAWGGGRYQLRVGRTVLYDFYADDQLFAAQAWGVLEIGAGALDEPPLTVRLRFEARLTRWKYLLRYEQPSADKYRQDPQSLSVTAAAKGNPKLPAILFESAPPPPGADAAFVSREAIALAERPAYTCSLRFALPAPLVVAQLPGAGVETVRRPPPAEPPGVPYSEILVHL